MGQLMIAANADCLKEHLDIAKKYGAAFEINDFFNPQILDDECKINELIGIYKEQGIPKESTMHGAFYDIVPFSYDPGIRQASVSRMHQSMDIAVKLGVKAVVFHTNVNPDLVSVVYSKRVIDEFEAVLSELLGKYPDINIYLENMFDSEPDILEEIAKRLCRYNNFGVCLDWAHALIYGNDIDAWIEKLKNYVRHIHINDNDLQKDLHLAVGSGLIDWEFFLKCYDKYFKECSVLIETGSPSMQLESINYLKKCMSDGKCPENSKRKLQPEETLEAIFRCMNRLAAERDFDAAILTLTELGRTLVNADRASFWYWDVGNRQYWTIAALGSERIVIPQGSGIVGASIDNGETILINDPYNDIRFNPKVDLETGYKTKSILCMPVYNAAGEVMGAIQAINKLDAAGFNGQDEKRLSLAAIYSGKLLEAHTLRMQNQIDALTGLRNRKGFYDYYENVILQYGNTGKTSIVMCDIDFFKKVNDIYGHNAGDAVLCNVAKILGKNFEASGEVFRWGGEEFIVLLKGGIESAFETAENARKIIEKSVCMFENNNIKITMSFGVSEIDVKRSSDLNVKQADELLYEAKKTGRNKVVV